MPKLLHEYWENETGGEFGLVRERSDLLRPTLMPNARLVFSLHASSRNEAMQLRNTRLGYGDYKPAQGFPNHVYTDEEAIEQEAYLRRRNVRKPPISDVTGFTTNAHMSDDFEIIAAARLTTVIAFIVVAIVGIVLAVVGLVSGRSFVGDFPFDDSEKLELFLVIGGLAYALHKFGQLWRYRSEFVVRQNDILKIRFYRPIPLGEIADVYVQEHWFVRQLKIAKHDGSSIRVPATMISEDLDYTADRIKTVSQTFEAAGS